LKDKDETEVAVQDIISILEYQSELKVQHLCSDNGSEFINTVID